MPTGYTQEDIDLLIKQFEELGGSYKEVLYEYVKVKGSLSHELMELNKIINETEI